MSGLFSPRLDVLPPPQRRLWNELTEIPPEFVLYGGTAIALYLGHRQSADFDFFGNCALNPHHLTLAIPFLEGAAVTQREPNTLSCVVDRDGPVQVSFFGLPEVPRLRPPSVAPDNGLRVASLIDLAGMKASVVQMRAEAKDYVDIDAILSDGQSICRPRWRARTRFTARNSIRRLRSRRFPTSRTAICSACRSG